MAGGTTGTPVTGSATAYATISEANAYFEFMMFTSEWDDAADADKTKALYNATLIIDSLCYTGEKTDDDQALEFPRDPDTEYPQDIQDACCEIARSLLAGYNPDMDYKSTNIKQTKFADVSTTYNVASLPEYITLGIPSVTAWRLLSSYICYNQGIDISRVN